MGRNYVYIYFGDNVVNLLCNDYKNSVVLAWKIELSYDQLRMMRYDEDGFTEHNVSDARNEIFSR